MADVLSRGTLFSPELVTDLIDRVKGKSSIARLSGQTPLPFNGIEQFIFTMDDKVDLVAENGAKSRGAVALTPVSIVPLKIEYGARISSEFMFASEEAKIEIMKNFNDGFAKKVARGLDIMAMHGVNPRTGSSSALIGTNHFDNGVTVVTAGSTADAKVENAIAAVQAHDYDVTGMAMAPAFRSALAAIKEGSSSNKPLFPELQWGASPDTLGGLTVDTNSTVSFTGTGTGNVNTDRAILGNFRDYFKWGIAREIPIEVIEYGNPDNDATAGDLKGHNQIYIRGEVFVGWGILVPAAFAMIQA
jgi:HK97 family phage major capsid protein